MQIDADSKKQLMKIDTFLERYEISRSQYYIQVRSGRLEVTQMGKSVFITRQDAEEWLALIRRESDEAKRNKP